MNKSGLIDELAKRTQITNKRADLIVNILFQSMKEALSKEERIEIRGFGSFSVKTYKPYQGRNPRTGAEIEVRSKLLPYFKVGKELKKRVDETES